MQRCAIVICMAVLVTAAGTAVAHPNDSIAREKVPPTPYGQQLVRTDAAEILFHGFLSDPTEEKFEFSPGWRNDYMAAIDSAEQSSGAYSLALVEPLASAGRALRYVEDHKGAMEHLRRALHLSRINQGLYSENQLPILEDMVKSQMAVGNIKGADDIQHYRFRVQQHAFSDNSPALIAATQEFVEWQRQLYLAGLGYETYRRLLKMHQLQTGIIEQLEAEDELHPELISHLFQRLGSEYLLADYQGEKQPHVRISISSNLRAGPSVSTDLEYHEFKMIRNNAFRSGVKTLKRIVELMEAQEPKQIEEIARARIALGDWYLWWDWKARAMQNYREAYVLYANDNDPRTDPQLLFQKPVELPQDPVFRRVGATPLDYTRDKARVSLTVSQLGRVRDLEILELDAAGDAMGARVTLTNMLKNVRFRPRVVDGEIVATHSVVREYRFDH